MISTNSIVSIAALIGTAQVALAGTNVQYRFGETGTWNWLYANESLSSPVHNVNLDTLGLGSGTWYFRVWNTPATEDLPFINFVSANQPRSIVLLAGNGATALSPVTRFAPACRDFGGVRAGGTPLTAQISISRDIRMPLGSPYNATEVDHLVRLDALGTIDSNVYQTGSDVPMGPVYCGSIGTGGSIQARGQSSSISLIDVNNGNVAGHIYALHGSIQSLTVWNGNVTGRIQALNGSFGDINISGALATPNYGSAGTTWPIRVTGGINKLIAGSISANITTQPDGAGNGQIGLLKTTNGPLSGGVALVEFTTPTGTNEGAGIDVNGDLSGSVRFLNGGHRTQNVVVRGSLTGIINFDTPQDLDGQVIVNAANSGGVWASDGKVQFGNINTPSIVISPSAPPSSLYLAPYYDATPAQLGGGSVGLVPFHLHDNACSPVNPPNGGASTQIPMDPGSVSLEFYGPIREEIEDHRPFNIQFFSSTRPVEVDATEWFDWTINGRVLTLVRNQCLPFGTYTVTPKLTGSERLLCITGLTTGAPVPVAPFEYLFRVQSNSITCPCYTSYECPLPGGCPADFDSNGGIDGADQAAFFVNYEAGCLCADVDENGGIDAGDLALFMTLYEAGGC